MKKFVKNAVLGLLLIPMLAFGVSAIVGAPVYAEDLTLQGGADAAQGEGVATELFEGDSAVFRTVTNILLFLVGAVTVIMLLIGGIRYVVSGGDQSAVTAAKNTILYAIVGIVVAFLAYAAVNFVLNSLANSV